LEESTIKNKETSYFFPKKVPIVLWHVIVVPVIVPVRIPSPAETVVSDENKSITVQTAKQAGVGGHQFRMDGNDRKNEKLNSHKPQVGGDSNG
jgi:hypothetical protein